MVLIKMDANMPSTCAAMASLFERPTALCSEFVSLSPFVDVILGVNKICSQKKVWFRNVISIKDSYNLSINMLNSLLQS